MTMAMLQFLAMDDRKWAKRFPMESSLPHEIVNRKGERVPMGYFKSRSAATRELNRRIKMYDKRRHGPEDPRKFTVQPVREGE